MKANILLVDDEPRFIDSLHSILKHYDQVFTGVQSGQLQRPVGDCVGDQGDLAGGS